MPETAIEWATHVWNPFTGCDRVSPGCAYCYAATSAKSLKAREQGRLAAAARRGDPAPKVRYQNDGDPKSSGPGFGFTVHWDKLENPEHFPAGARVFVNSMSDVFHEEAPDGAIAELFGAAAAQAWANFLILTKRPERMRHLLDSEDFWETVNALCLSHGEVCPATRGRLFLPNVWLGVSIENRRFVHRADLLRQMPAAVRFISAEPLLGPLVPRVEDFKVEHGDYGQEHGGEWFWPDGKLVGEEAEALDLTDIDWLIVGGESGMDHRPIRPEWVRDLRDWTQAVTPAAERIYPTKFFFKQWGGRRAKSGGRELDGRTWDEIPEPLSPVST